MLRNKPESGIVSEEQHPSRDFLSLLFTSLTVLASVITIFPFISSAQMLQPPPAVAPPPGAVTPPPPVQHHGPISSDGERCVLEKTDVSAQVVGYTARVTVKQRFRNPNAKKFNAVYTFPLSDSAAVDEMVMKMGNRVVRGKIDTREQAREIFEVAQSRGQTASLLEQHRTNIFTQSVANVPPHETIEVEIKYTDTLAFEAGQYHLVFPTKVGPRFTPAGTVAPPDTDSNGGVFEGYISFNAQIDAGLPIHDLKSNFDTSMLRTENSNASVVMPSIKPGTDIDVAWSVLTDKIENGVVAHRKGNEGYLTAMLMPPQRVTVSDVAPKEMVFLIDCSGSQSGPPLEKAKETLHYIVEHMNPEDTFQIVAFSNEARTFAPEALRVSREMKVRAHKWIDTLEADGGTMMAPAVEKVCHMPAPKNRLRIVTFMTDGFVGNDMEIVDLVRKLRGNTRWFPFGTGTDVNRALIDGIAKEGGGEPEYVDLNENGEVVGREFYKRISTPVLTDVKIKFEGIEAAEVYPKQPMDIWAQRPLYFHARYNAASATSSGLGGWFGGGAPKAATAIITGFAGGKPYSARLPISLPTADTNKEAVAQLWARHKIDDLMSQDLTGIQDGKAKPEICKEITDVALKHHLMSQFTSFVAVDDSSHPYSTNTDGTSQSQDIEASNSAVSAEQGYSAVSTDGSDLFAGTAAGVNGSWNGSAVDTGAQTAMSLNAPALQGATNGTLGPQSVYRRAAAQGAPLTFGEGSVIAGVNTAGTVRVNKLAYLDAAQNMLANLFACWVVIYGVFIIAHAMLRRASALKVFGVPLKFGWTRRLVSGMALVIIGIWIPAGINAAAAWMRGVNIFS